MSDGAGSIGEYRGEPIRPHRKDGYRPRSRVHVRVDDETLAGIDRLADALRLSRAHVCDVILAIAVEDEPGWLRQRISQRVREALQAHRARWR